MERCCLLYEKGKIKNEVNKLIIQKNFELKDKQLLSKCTFKPRINSVKTLSARKDSNKFAYNVYERNDNWMRNRNEKYMFNLTNLFFY